MISVSGMFAVTFSIAFAYVADCTEENERSTAYGLVRYSFVHWSEQCDMTAKAIDVMPKLMQFHKVTLKFLLKV